MAKKRRQQAILLQVGAIATTHSARREIGTTASVVNDLQPGRNVTEARLPDYTITASDEIKLRPVLVRALQTLHRNLWAAITRSHQFVIA